MIRYKNEMKFYMLMLMNAWMMIVLMKCKCQMQCLTLGCYRRWHTYVISIYVTNQATHFAVSVPAQEFHFSPTPQLYICRM